MAGFLAFDRWQRIVKAQVVALLMLRHRKLHQKQAKRKKRKKGKTKMLFRKIDVSKDANN